MSDPFLGEIQVYPYSYVPYGWALCNGQILTIQSNPTLFGVIGNAYGGNGTTNFALPNFVGRVAINQGQGPGLSQYVVGQTAGAQTVQLAQSEMPMHTHPLQLGVKTSTNSTAGPTGGSNVAIDPAFNGFVAPPVNTSFAPISVVASGGSQPHANAQPYLAMAYCIALQGSYPQFS